MNNRIIPMLALMAGAFAWSSCSSTDIFEEEVDVKGEMTITATGNGVDTRASIGDENSVIWNKGDEISVFGKDKSNTRFELISGAGTTTGSFKGSGDPSTEYFAIYPYNDNSYRVQASGGQDELMVYWNGAEQTVAGNSLSNAPMVAHTADADQYSNSFPLTFQNACALVKFTTDYRCKSVTFKARGGEAIAAETLWMTFDEDGKSSIYQAGETSSTVTLTGKDGEYIQAGTYYIAVLPGTLSSGFDITFTNIYDEKTYTKTGTKAATLTRSKILNLGTISIKSEMIHLDGTGTEADPYLIHDFDQLEEMRDFVNYSTGGADYFKLYDDIDGEGKSFTPIGTQSKPFFGHFDGNGKTISNIKLGQTPAYDIADLDTKYLMRHTCISALFGVIKNAVIKNVTIDQVSTYTNSEGELTEFDVYTIVKSPFIGVVLGDEEISSLIMDITVNATQNISMNDAVFNQVGWVCYGGIVGSSFANMTVEKCTSYNSISGKARWLGMFGGIVGNIKGGQEDDDDLDFDAKVNIHMCRNFGNIEIKKIGTDVSCIAGGIVSNICNEPFDNDVKVQIASCINFGNIDTKDPDNGYSYDHVGGIVGIMESDGFGSEDPLIFNCINNGTITTLYHAGGICGSVDDDDTHVDCCANTGTIDSRHPSSIVGTLWANYYSGTVTRCWNNNTSCTYMCDATRNGENTNISDSNNNGGSVDECIALMNERLATPIADPTISVIRSWKKYSEDPTMLDLDF